MVNTSLNSKIITIIIAKFITCKSSPTGRWLIRVMGPAGRLSLDFPLAMSRNSSVYSYWPGLPPIADDPWIVSGVSTHYCHTTDSISIWSESNFTTDDKQNVKTVLLIVYTSVHWFGLSKWLLGWVYCDGEDGSDVFQVGAK